MDLNIVRMYTACVCAANLGQLLSQNTVINLLIHLFLSPKLIENIHYLITPLSVCIQIGSPLAWSFNLSHQGDYAVLAAEQGLQVGVDIMKTAMPGKC